MPELWVAVVRTLSRPMETRAGDDSTLIQKDTHDRMTMRIEGTKTWMRKKPISRRRMNRISWHGNAPTPDRRAKPRSNYTVLSNVQQERLAAASIARDDPSTLPGDDAFPRARVHRDRNAR